MSQLPYENIKEIEQQAYINSIHSLNIAVYACHDHECDQYYVAVAKPESEELFVTDYNDTQELNDEVYDRINHEFHMILGGRDDSVN